MAEIYKTSFDEDTIIATLIPLAQKYQFRSAWNFLQNNVDPQHVRFSASSAILQYLSNMYGDISLKDECFLKKELETQIGRVIQLLI